MWLRAYLSNFRYFPKIYLPRELPVLFDKDREGGWLLASVSSFELDCGVYADGT
jgi:hypothetical protein